MTRRPTRLAVIAGLLLLLVVVATLSFALGSAAISVRDVVATFIGNGPDGTAPSLAVQRIVLELRVPRALLAVIVGSGLALVGALLQTATRNDLADPFLFGLSAGAAAGAVAVIALIGDLLGRWTLPAATFTGGLLAAGSVLLLVARSQGTGSERMVLAGLAISFLFSAITNVLVFAGDQRAAHSALFWSLGGLGLARWDNLAIPLGGWVAVAAYVLHRRDALDALLAGDDTAHSLGIDPQRVRVEGFIVAAFATACFVAFSGVIGFVGLMVPHVARAVGGPLHRRCLPLAALLGALLLLGSDIASRVLLAPQELPVGIVTASIGAVFVIAMLWRRPSFG